MSKLLPILLDQFALSLRRLLRGGAALTMAGIAGTNTLSQAFAKGPLVNTQAPNFYRFKLGGAEATILTDGVLPLGDPHASFTGLTKEEMDRQLRDKFLPADNVSLEQNILVLNTGDKLVVFDTGLGGLKGFGPATGKMMSTLKQAGIDPNDVDAIVMSHAHVDHCGGCMADDGSRNFPNAQYYISQLDYEFWTTERNVPAQFKVFWETATKNLVPNRDRMVFIKDGQEFLPGIQAISAPGHTVGHTIFMITSGGKSLCYAGDLAHHPVLMMEKPLTEFVYDTDTKQSAQTRVRTLSMLAEGRVPLLAYHFPWPGIGHVAKQGDGFRYYPEAMKLDL